MIGLLVTLLTTDMQFSLVVGVGCSVNLILAGFSVLDLYAAAEVSREYSLKLVSMLEYLMFTIAVFTPGW